MGLMAETTTQLFETTNQKILSKLQSTVESVPLEKKFSDPGKQTWGDLTVGTFIYKYKQMKIYIPG